MKDPTKLKELIHEKLNFAKVMIDYGVEFVYNPLTSDETQFKCPIHGKDNKPSARYYKETNSSYCWVCMKRFDNISFMMEKEGLSFLQAIRYIIDRYKIDTSSIPDDPEFKIEKVVPISENSIRIRSIKNRLMDLKGKIEFKKYRALCSALYMITYDIFKGKDAVENTKKLEHKLGTFSGVL